MNPTWIKFLEDTQGPIAKTEKLAGDASSRTFSRIFFKSGQTAIASDNSSIEGCFERVVLTGNFLKTLSLPVPEILSTFPEQKIVLFEDFGDRYLADISNPEIHSREIWSWIKTLRTASLPFGVLSPMDASFLWNEWRFVMSDPRTQDLSENLSKFESILKKTWGNIPMEPAHRDLMSRNILVTNNNRLGLIDFQDLRLAPKGYDFVSFAMDPYPGWNLKRYLNYLQAYCDHTGLNLKNEKQTFELIGIQRVVKAIGTFLNQDLTKGKSHYLKFIPSAIQCLDDLQAEQYIPGISTGLLKLKGNLC